MEETIEEYQNSTDENLVKFVRNVKNGVFRKPSQRSYTIGRVTERAAADINRLTRVDVIGFHHNMKGNAVRHIEKRHGEHGEHDHTMADVNDYGRIRYILDNYDDVKALYDNDGDVLRSDEFVNPDNVRAPLVRYEKRINGAFHYVVVAVPDTKAKRLPVVSAYKEWLK